MSNWNKNEILKFLKSYAYEAPVGRAIGLADDFDQISRELHELQEAVAILSETVIKLDDHGAIPVELKSNRSAIRWALSKVQYCHGWVKLGPISNAMTKLMERVEDEIKRGIRQGW
ncbi:hypothetical protein LCGC14_1657840 [marine sediment metagenome]|uniref:Uncharacterized protein n=1 Tax=marine sediment metagenome TaxID=412755 RepID=A0A0F9KV66_9ZZZZ